MSTTSEPHLVVETDTESDEDDSFFDLELTPLDFDNKENNTNTTTTKNDDDPKQTTTSELKSLGSKDETSLILFHFLYNHLTISDDGSGAI